MNQIMKSTFGEKRRKEHAVMWTLNVIPIQGSYGFPEYKDVKQCPLLEIQNQV